MSGETYVVDSIASLRRLIDWLRTLDFRKPWSITVKRIEPGASVELEAVLRGKERLIADFTGHDMEEIHEEMLIRHYGKRTITFTDGTTREVPARRTRTGKDKLAYSEMVQHIRFVEAFGAQLGIQMR
jgi:hypothetical protein